MVVNIHEAKTHFSPLVDRVMRGEEVVIGKAGSRSPDSSPTARMIRVGFLVDGRG
jgi:antitoxin (DNA-binding transcriptional repressor) of toxin-antitoxin stability system